MKNTKFPQTINFLRDSNFCTQVLQILHENSNSVNKHANVFGQMKLEISLRLSDSYPAFFLLIATTSNKKFLNAQTVNVKFNVYEFGDKEQ
jgi:hypothetical protein